MHKPEKRKDVGLFAQDDPQNEILVSIQSGPKEYYFLQNNALEEVKKTSKCKGIKKNTDGTNISITIGQIVPIDNVIQEIREDTRLYQGRLETRGVVFKTSDMKKASSTITDKCFYLRDK